MLRTLMAVGLISLTIACAHKEAGKGLSKLTDSNSGTAETSGLQKTPAFDSTFYIGYVDYFPETREFYTTLFYRDGHEYPDEDLLESKLDSSIVFDEDWGRERLPLDEARKMLVLDGLDTIAVYNRKHEAICRCPLTRVEYLWNGLESYFIAVFKSDKTFPGQTEELYGISADFPRGNFSGTSAEEIINSKPDHALLNRLNLSKVLPWDMRHYKISPGDNIFSILSNYSMDTNLSQSYLTLSTNDTSLILNEEINNYHYLNILPVPVAMKGKPLVLISAGYPSSDVVWDYLAGFDGLRYEAIPFNRIHLKDISSEWSQLLSKVNQE